MNEKFATIKKTAINVLYFVALLWVIKVVDVIMPFSLSQFGIVPRTFGGLAGILFAPFLHANIFHLLSNTIPVFVLLFVLLLFYKNDAPLVITFSVLLGGLLVWIFGRSASHIGISGLIYSLAAFLITAGFLRKDFKSVVVSLAIIILYGGLIWGIFPGRYWISWEGHLFGALVGVFIAFYFFKKDKKSNNLE
ncbi:MAG: rhomboid family intramembrane serine protease [Salinivirgaceae bacterium]|jgi:membrane associated rhomboid family serine protease|nr:rhomboid family intramembrane serine protease [Salinivirgaceae bacterium]